MKIIVDGKSANLSANKLYIGNGMVSANNSSRLLLDYKYENPDAYQKILEYIFGENGLCVNHLKIEMGSDANTSSGTEPCIKRFEDEQANVARGAGFILAYDAKKINPDLTLDMLWWSEPLWISNSNDIYASRYKWYKETLDEAFKTFGLKFDYVSAVRNEREADVEWIKYLSSHLKSEKSGQYDYSKIKIVVGDEVGTWYIADRIIEDEELLNAIDVIGGHYTSASTENAKKLSNIYGKQLWLSEGSTPMSYPNGVERFDKSSSGLSGINGVLDIANRFISMYPQGLMTMCQYQPIVSSYYDGVTYSHKQFITANEPWSGRFTLDCGFYASLHFTRFIKKGWAYIESACFADGRPGGDGHAIVEAKHSYIALTDTKNGDYSIVMTNTTQAELKYDFEVSNLENARKCVDVWETDGYTEERRFKFKQTIEPVKSDEKYKYSVTVKPNSIITISTLKADSFVIQDSNFENEGILKLPYADDFEYDKEYLSERGGAPKFTTDQGGAFEVCNFNGNNVLMQKILESQKPLEWGYTPEPTTNFGDDRWFNYSISADVKLCKSEKPICNYAGIGLRYNLADIAKSGYWIAVYESGYWCLNKNSFKLLDGNFEKSFISDWMSLKLTACYDVVKAYLNGSLLCEYKCADESLLSAGRASIYSSYNRNCFDNLNILPINGADTYISRFDNTDPCFEYQGNWQHETMSIFRNYKRTISHSIENASLVFKFSGSGFSLSGLLEQDCILDIKIDGQLAESNYKAKKSGNREIFYYNYSLENDEHNVEVVIKSGKLSVDFAEVIIIL